jgi:hypothetical protein
MRKNGNGEIKTRFNERPISVSCIFPASDKHKQVYSQQIAHIKHRRPPYIFRLLFQLSSASTNTLNTYTDLLYKFLSYAYVKIYNGS